MKDANVPSPAEVHASAVSLTAEVDQLLEVALAGPEAEARGRLRELSQRLKDLTPPHDKGIHAWEPATENLLCQVHERLSAARRLLAARKRRALGRSHPGVTPLLKKPTARGRKKK
jgi:hypothetical protein